jgi:hypothetical protein
MTDVSGSLVCPKTLKMGQTSDPKMLVIHQKTTPGKNPEDFKQHYDHGRSLQLHTALNLLDLYDNDRTGWPSRLRMHENTEVEN